jgi:PAP2 superfamily C-terminal
VACVVTSVADDPVFAVALWSMVALDYAVEIYEGFHYSVDMWLGMVLVSLLWRVLKPLEGVTDNAAQPAVGGSPIQAQQQPITVQSVAMYLPPALVVYIQLIALPQSTANFLIVFYAASAVVIGVTFVWKETQEAKRQFYTHYSQHILLCLLFLAFGIYL